MKKIVEKMSNKKFLIMQGGMFVILCLLANTLWKQQFIYLTQTFNYTVEQAYHLLNEIGESGRNIHMRILLVDVAMVILYTCFLIGMNYKLSCSITKNCHFITIVTFCPLLLAVIQMGEVMSIFVMILNYENEYANIARLANTLTIIKYNLTPVCFGLPIVLFGVKMVKKMMSNLKGKRIMGNEG